MKTNSGKMGKDKDRIYREYTDIIKPLNDTSNHDHN